MRKQFHVTIGTGRGKFIVWASVLFVWLSETKIFTNIGLLKSINFLRYLPEVGMRKLAVSPENSSGVLLLGSLAVSVLRREHLLSARIWLLREALDEFGFQTLERFNEHPFG